MSHFTGERPIIEAVRTLDPASGIKYKIFSDDWTIKLTNGTKTRFITGYGLDFNTQAAAQNAKDKVIAYQLMADQRIPAVPHILLSHLLQPEVDKELIDKLLNAYGRIVIKPTQGSGGRMVAVFTSCKDALNFIQSHEITSWCASPLVNIKSEMRIVVFDQDILLAFIKTGPAVRKGLAMFNLSKGARTSVIATDKLPDSLKQLALESTKALGLRLAAVDIVFDEHGQASVLEVNAAFSLDHFSASSPVNHDLAIKLYQDLIKKLFN